jgi:hypothetical protein
LQEKRQQEKDRCRRLKIPYIETEEKLDAVTELQQMSVKPKKEIKREPLTLERALTLMGIRE